MKKTIGLVAHDDRKKDLIEWINHNSNILSNYKLVCTGTTGKLVLDSLSKKGYLVDIEVLRSGPLGGDQELGARISNNEINILIFFWDPMGVHPHDVDFKALLRLAVLYNVPTACNRSTADYLISSPLINDKQYKPVLKDYSNYLNRKNYEKT